MIELQGKYNSCKVFAESIDDATRGQLEALLNQPMVEGSQIRIMPDTHAGAGCVIGTTMTLKDKVVPNLVGVDIGCSVLAVQLKDKRINLTDLDSVIHKQIPSGMEVHKAPVTNVADLDKIKATVNIERAELSLGTLGGGNHFIEVDRASDGTLWLVIHTGSRHLGLEVCKYYQDRGYEQLNIAQKGDIKELRRALIDDYKAKGKETEIGDALQALNDKYKSETIDVPYELAYVEGTLFDDYIHDMRIVQAFASKNRATIANRIIKAMGLKEVDRIETMHNYIDCDNLILRKGSISARENERVLIPMNMRDGTLLCVGKGNADWNYSAPHGAGRLMSRRQARENIAMSDYKQSMKGIFTTCVNRGTVDESPMAYKPMESIIEQVKETVDILDILKPIYNFKAADNE